MFKAGAFSSDQSQPFQVDAAGLKRMTVESLAEGMQVSPSNPMAGLEGRAGLLMRLSEALSNQEIFGDDGRPGNMIGESNYGLGKCIMSRQSQPWSESYGHELTRSLLPGGVFFPMVANHGRLSPISSDNHDFFSAYSVFTDAMVCVDGRPLEHMAGNPDADKWRIIRRRMAMLFDAIKSSSAAMGGNCPIS
jgi:hypothetical protein